jgi:RNA polymerase-binding transcription factor DksA
MRATIERAAQALARRRAAIYGVQRRNQDERGQLEQQLRDDTRTAATDAPLVTVLDALNHDEVREIVEIDAALERIKSGDYGRCETCGGAIGSQRLNALPETRYCITCASAAERNPMRGT